MAEEQPYQEHWLRKAGKALHGQEHSNANKYGMPCDLELLHIQE